MLPPPPPAAPPDGRRCCCWLLPPPAFACWWLTGSVEQGTGMGVSILCMEAGAQFRSPTNRNQQELTTANASAKQQAGPCAGCVALDSMSSMRSSNTHPHVGKRDALAGQCVFCRVLQLATPQHSFHPLVNPPDMHLWLATRNKDMQSQVQAARPHDGGRNTAPAVTCPCSLLQRHVAPQCTSPPPFTPQHTHAHTFRS